MPRISRFLTETKYISTPRPTAKIRCSYIISTDNLLNFYFKHIVMILHILCFKFKNCSYYNFANAKYATDI